MLIHWTTWKTIRSEEQLERSILVHRQDAFCVRGGSEVLGTSEISSRTGQKFRERASHW